MAALPLDLGPTPALAASKLSPALAAKAGASPASTAKARAAAQDFEAVFLNAMFAPMFSGVGEGPFSGGQAAKTWQGFLVDEYAKGFAKAGGIGIADTVYRELIAQQEARGRA
jgi:Rod binding domain-containing protein